MTQRGRPHYFYFSNKTEFFRQASHYKWCSEIPDKGAGVLEMQTTSIHTKASSLKVSLSTSCPAGATVPQPGCPHLQTMTEDNIPNSATKERKPRPRLSEGFYLGVGGGTHLSRLPCSKRKWETPRSQPVPTAVSNNIIILQLYSLLYILPAANGA